MAQSNEKRFLQLFERHFHGADVQGRPDSGFINLLKMKGLHCRAFWGKFSQRLDQIIEKNCASPEAKALREEIFDKLHTFFSRYFSESGSVYFRDTPAWQPIYQRVDNRDNGEYCRVDDPGRDVMLVWKTSMLHYVKTDMTLKNMTVKLESKTREPAPGVRVFAFDVSKLPPKKNNERRDFIFKYAGKADDPQNPDAIRIEVHPARNGGKTKFAELAAEAAESSELQVHEDNLREAATKFLRQSEADYFINRNPRHFLKEQLDLWMFSYALRDSSEFSKARISELRAIREISELVIDFVAQFENQLLRIWEKPKFARAINYVVTADRLPAEILKKAVNSPGAKPQIAEWQKLNLVPDNFVFSNLLKGEGELQFLPLDTKHFKELETEILQHLAKKYGGENAILDRALDGELVHSENWQTLNTLGRKFKGQVKCIHIDPPYNTDTSGFLYVNNYKHSTWLTMMEGRIEAAIPFLSEDGVFQCHIDENEYERLHLLFEKTPTLNAGTLVWDKQNPMLGGKGIAMQHEYIIWRTMRTASFYLRSVNAKMIIAKAKSFMRKYGGVNAKSRQEFAAWIDANPKLSGGERSYRNLDNDGRIYQSVAMVWPNPSQPPEQFFVPLIHPSTGKPCPVPPKGWSQSPVKMKELQDRDEIIFGKDESVQPRRKIFLSGDSSRQVSSILRSGSRGSRDMDALDLDFSYCHPVSVYEDLLGATTPDKSGIILDFFAGSGTTAHAVLNLNREDNGSRKFILAELGEHFDSALLPRVKKIMFSPEWGDGKPKKPTANGKNHRGGAFKYYTLEQYEQSLAHARYRNEDPNLTDPTPYVFMRDPKMAWCVEVGKESLEILLDKLYPDIDLAETLSHARGLPVKSRTAEEVVLGERESDWKKEKYRIDWKGEMSPEDKARLLEVLRPYLWWE